MAGELRIKDESVEWLDETLPAAVGPLDLENAYNFVHGLNSSRALVIEVLAPDKPLTYRFQWGIKFFDSAGDESCEKPVRSEVWAGRLRHGDNSRGPVAQGLSLFIKLKNKLQGLGTRICDNEEKLYRDWGIPEIQLVAVEDGLVFWVKQRRFVPVHPQSLQVKYRVWARKNNQSEDPPDDPSLYPVSFLSDLVSLELYLVLT